MRTLFLSGLIRFLDAQLHQAHNKHIRVLLARVKMHPVKANCLCRLHVVEFVIDEHDLRRQQLGVKLACTLQRLATQEHK